MNALEAYEASKNGRIGFVQKLIKEATKEGKTCINLSENTGTYGELEKLLGNERAQKDLEELGYDLNLITTSNNTIVDKANGSVGFEMKQIVKCIEISWEKNNE